MDMRTPGMWTRNTQNVGDGIEMLEGLPNHEAACVVFDPQYRAVLDKQKYGNEGSRQKHRSDVPNMDDLTIRSFIHQIARVLRPSGHLFLWIDKFQLCQGSVLGWIENVDLELVDLVIWDKVNIGMGYRTRNRAEFLVVLQKEPKRCKGVWTKNDIPNVWAEKAKRGKHRKPTALMAELIEAVTQPGDLVVDPAAGTYTTLTACRAINRDFLGCDIVGNQK